MVSLLNRWLGVILSFLMNSRFAGIDCKSQQLFCSRFKRRMRELLARHQPAAEAFGPVWEETLDEVSLNDAEQAQVYWELIAWAGNVELLLVKTRLSIPGETTRPPPDREAAAGRPPSP